jgi:hypothetical protein
MNYLPCGDASGFWKKADLRKEGQISFYITHDTHANEKKPPKHYSLIFCNDSVAPTQTIRTTKGNLINQGCHSKIFQITIQLPRVELFRFERLNRYIRFFKFFYPLQ